MSNPVALRKCPTCAGPIDGLGLRDYGTWLADALPGRVSGSDIDCVVEQSKTGRVLMMEFKPKGVPVPMGQRLMLRTLKRKGIDVWVVWEDGNVLEAGDMDDAGQVRFVATLTRKGLVKQVRDWWYAGLEEV